MTKTILVIDDDPVTISLLKSRLNAHGYGVRTATDGQLGLELAREDPPDLIILDIMMPKINGYSVCSILKASDSYRSIPIIMLTVRRGKVDKTFARDCRPNSYITKPFKMEHLLRNVSRLVPAT